MKTFEKECWVRYGAGEYGYKNGTTVSRIKKGLWIVNKFGKLVYTSTTLTDCKLYVGRYC